VGYIMKLWQITKVPFNVSVKKARAMIIKKLQPEQESNFRRKYFESSLDIPFDSLHSGYFKFPSIDYLSEREELLEYVSRQILKHNFNLLGTGWINRNFQIPYQEIICLLPDFWKSRALDLVEMISNKDYHPIDYWTDPCTNYQWKLKYYKEIEIILGADIKHPWEIGRMQHLPFLAICYYYWKDRNIEFAHSFSSEFQNEILDFIATNPVGYSVQWRSAMDVSIRLANWLVAYDLFVTAGCSFAKNFLDVFYESVYKHIMFVIDNFEWSEGLRGNHYFANITAIVFSALYLPNSEFTTKLLAFGLNELINEVFYQFLPDGGNFEASTYYHIQVVEMLLLSLYLISLISKDKIGALSKFCKEYHEVRLAGKKSKGWLFEVNLKEEKINYPEKFYELLQNILTFTLSIRKSNNHYEQIGDNDSGFFLRLNYFFNNYYKDAQIFEDILKRPLLDDLIYTFSPNGKHSSNSFFLQTRNQFFYLAQEETTLQPKVYPFKDFGLYVVKSNLYDLIIRGGSIGQRGKGGHSHNDQLSFTLCVEGEDFFVDPGLFCYTCSESERNLYRSAHFHNTLSLPGCEQNLWKTGDVENLFWIYRHKTKTKILTLSDGNLVLEHYAYKKPHRRTFVFHPELIQIEDFLRLDSPKLIYFHLHPSVEVKIEDNRFNFKANDVEIELTSSCRNYIIQDYDYCPQYGLNINSKRIVFQSDGFEEKWVIRIK